MWVYAGDSCCRSFYISKVKSVSDPIHEITVMNYFCSLMLKTVSVSHLCTFTECVGACLGLLSCTQALSGRTGTEC